MPQHSLKIPNMPTELKSPDSGLHWYFSVPTSAVGIPEIEKNDIQCQRCFALLYTNTVYIHHVQNHISLLMFPFY